MRCIVFTHNSKVYVRDTGSLNGTYVNGVRIDRPAVLSTGDVVVSLSLSSCMDYITFIDTCLCRRWVWQEKEDDLS